MYLKANDKDTGDGTKNVFYLLLFGKSNAFITVCIFARFLHNDNTATEPAN